MKLNFYFLKMLFLVYMLFQLALFNLLNLNLEMMLITSGIYFLIDLLSLSYKINNKIKTELNDQ